MADVKFLKSFLKKMRNSIKDLDMGIKEYYNIFDQDGSDEIELDEFLKMLELL